MKSYLAAIAAASVACHSVSASDWRSLPESDASVQIPAQEWEHRPGSRTIRVRIVYPDGSIKSVTPRTGIMLTLHNWGGEDCAGTADPRAIARRLNVVAVCVNYLQSGRRDAIDASEPYDFGYLQALDAIRALWFVDQGLKQQRRTFDRGRIYCAGGSGGGNVSLMANKLAPRTFACIVDMCGMKKLNHDIAFHLEGGSGLNARWSRSPNDANFLTVDHQELRFVGHPRHLATMKALGTTAKVVVVHGELDRTCPYADAVEMVTNMTAANLQVEPRFITESDLDGRVFTSAGHPLGNRTEIVFRVAGRYLAVDSPDLLRREAPNDFDRRQDVRYATSNGTFVISYKQGFPVGRFEPNASPPEYRDHADLSYVLDENKKRHPVLTTADWKRRRRHIRRHLERVMGTFPAPTSRVALDVKVVAQYEKDGVAHRKITYQSDPFDRVGAWLLHPTNLTSPTPAVLCLHQTVKAGKDEPVGLSGKPSMHYAIELARRGYVTLSPDYPSLGEHAYDFDKNPEYVSGSMKAIWDNVRAIDLLTSRPEVDPDRIGVIGHSLGGHNAMFTATFDDRLKVIVSSCGFSTLLKDDVPSWTGPRYMPRIATQFSNRADRVPFDFTEIVAGFAPRPFLAVAATDDSDFDVSGVRDALAAAKPIYELYNRADHLHGVYPESPHDFPRQARETAYEFLDTHLRK